MNPSDPKVVAQQSIANATAFAYNISPDAIPLELLDFVKIIKMGAEKYALNGWLEADGKKCSEKDMHSSMLRHLIQSLMEGKDAKDHESNLDPLLHLACRALMLYTRRQKGIIHPEDNK